MRVSQALELFKRAEEQSNHYYKPTLQVNFIHPLSDLPADSELQRDFLKGKNQVLSNFLMKTSRNDILKNVIADLESAGEYPELVKELKAFEKLYSQSVSL